MAYYRDMGITPIDSMEQAVLRSFAALESEEFEFLAERRNVVLSRLPLFEESFRNMRNAARAPRIDAPFDVLDPDCPAPRSVRFSALSAPGGEKAAGGRLSVAMVHGSFDPFHLGHLFMALDAVCDGTCDFALLMPNADRSRGGATVKPDKSPFGWRTRTVLSGGAEDLFPALRFTSFGFRGGTVESHRRLLEANRKRIEGLERFTLWIVIGSDILYRPDFARWTNETYRELLESVRLAPLEIRFRIVERRGFPFERSLVASLDYPCVSVSEVSLASSTAIREDPVGAMWLYPGGVLALESFLIYGQKP